MTTEPKPNKLPDAWLYSNKRHEEVFAQPNRANMDPRYWTEKALYVGPIPDGPADPVARVLADYHEGVGEHGVVELIRQGSYRDKVTALRAAFEKNGIEL